MDDDQGYVPERAERRLLLGKSGSQNRKRRFKRTVALNEEEAAIFDEMADRAGVSISSLIRSAVLSYPLERAARRPTVNHKAAAQLLGELGAVADALRDAADACSNPDEYRVLLDAACRDLSEMRLLWFQAMGREP